MVTIGSKQRERERERAVVDTSVCSSILGGHNHENIEYIGAYITLKTSSTSSRKRKVLAESYCLHRGSAAGIELRERARKSVR